MVREQCKAINILPKNNNIRLEEYENSKPRAVNFLGYTDAFNLIDKTGYINKFNDIDLQVRGCENHEQCHTLYKNNLINFPANEKKLLRHLTNRIDKILRNRHLISLHTIPWKFARIRKNNLEGGMPHTHMDTIYLTDKFFQSNSLVSEILHDPIRNIRKSFSQRQTEANKIDVAETLQVRTLIHEKIHIYQRNQPQRTMQFYKSNGFAREEDEQPRLKRMNQRRANPDVDSYDYNYKGTLFYNEYNDKAKSLTDTKIVYTNSLNTSNENTSNLTEERDADDDDLDSIGDAEETPQQRFLKKLENQGYQIEHPNEIFASKIADDITNEKTLDKNTLDYLK